MLGNQWLTCRHPGAAFYAWFLGFLIPLSSDWKIKSLQAHTLPCLLSPSLPQAIKKHYILKWNKGNGNQKSMFCMRSKTYVENGDAKWWICTSPLAILPSAFLLWSESELCRPATWPTLASHLVQVGLAEPWPDFVLWTSSGSMRWHGARNTQDASQPWKHLWVQKEAQDRLCLFDENGHYHVLSLF